AGEFLPAPVGGAEGGQRLFGLRARGLSLGLRGGEALARFFQCRDVGGVAADLAFGSSMGFAGRIRRTLGLPPALAGFAFRIGGGGGRRLGRFKGTALAVDVDARRGKFALERPQPPAFGRTAPRPRRRMRRRRETGPPPQPPLSPNHSLHG